MKALVLHGVGDIRVDDIDHHTICASTDAVIRLTAGAIRGADPAPEGSAR